MKGEKAGTVTKRAEGDMTDKEKDTKKWKKKKKKKKSIPYEKEDKRKLKQKTKEEKNKNTPKKTYFILLLGLERNPSTQPSDLRHKEQKKSKGK